MEANSYLYVGGIVKDSTVDGPGLRHVIFLSGCSWDPKCDGCQNTTLWSQESGVKMTLDALIEEVDDYLSGDVGLTISGGEPLDQAVNLYAFLQYIKHKRFLRTRFYLDIPASDVMLYTRHKFEDIQVQYPSILSVSDIIVDGPYLCHLPSARWRGSENQNIWQKENCTYTWHLTNI
jgi:organic radical activating enzyme